MLPLSQSLPLLEEALVKAATSDPMVIFSIIEGFSHAPNLKKNSAYHRYIHSNTLMLEQFHYAGLQYQIALSWYN